MFYISQLSQFDCGYTCVKILLANHYHDKNYLFLKDKYSFTHAYSFKELIDLANLYGINLTGFTVKEKNSLRNHKKYPLLLTLVRGRMLHMVYVYKVSKRYVYYLDPELGKRREKFSSFISSWDGKGLLICKTYPIKKLLVEKPYFGLKLSSKIILFFLQLVSFIFIFLALLFVDKNLPNYYCYIFLGVFALSEVVLRRYSLFCLKDIDDSIYKHVNNVKKREYHNFYLAITDYKKIVVTNKLNFLGTLLSGILICVVLSLNSPSNLIFILIPFLINLSARFLFPQTFKSNIQKIGLLERKVSTSYTSEEFIVNSKLANKIANKIGLLTLTIKYMSLFIIMVSVFLVMMLQGIYNISFVLVNTAFSYYLYTVFDYLFTYKEKKDELNKTYAKIIAYIN